MYPFKHLTYTGIQVLLISIIDYHYPNSTDLRDLTYMNKNRSKTQTLIWRGEKTNRKINHLSECD